MIKEEQLKRLDAKRAVLAAEVECRRTGAAFLIEASAYVRGKGGDLARVKELLDAHADARTALAGLQD